MTPLAGRWQRLTLATHGERPAGALSFVGAESGEFPFPIKRAFWIYDWESGDRGGHAHRRCQQLFVCLSGGVALRLHLAPMQGATRLYDKVFLQDPSQALLVGPMTWVEMQPLSIPGEHTVLLCLCSEPYDEAEYIRSQEEFDRLWKGTG